MSLPPHTPPPPPPPNPKPPGGPGRRFYSVRSLAEEWEVTPQHVYNLISAGLLAVFDIGQGKAKTRIEAKEVERFVATRTRRATRGRAA